MTWDEVASIGVAVMVILAALVFSGIFEDD